MKISITLPSLNSGMLLQTLDNIERTTRDHEVEVLVCTPFEVGVRHMMSGRCRLVWIEDTEMSGCVAAHWACYKKATGDLITAFADDHSYVDGWDVLAVENFLRQEAWYVKGVPLSLGLRQVSPTPHVGTMFGIYYPYFPVMRLDEVKAIGGWYDATRYKRGFSDPDLGMRVWDAGGRCVWADAQTIICHGSGPADWYDDMPRFLERWAPKYGKGWDLSHVRGWDIDRPVSDFEPEARTCHQNALFS